MVQPSLGILTVWLGVLVAISARALKNHTRVQGDTWMRAPSGSDHDLCATYARMRTLSHHRRRAVT